MMERTYPKSNIRTTETARQYFDAAALVLFCGFGMSACDYQPTAVLGSFCGGPAKCWDFRTTPRATLTAQGWVVPMCWASQDGPLTNQKLDGSLGGMGCEANSPEIVMDSPTGNYLLEILHQSRLRAVDSNGVVFLTEPGSMNEQLIHRTQEHGDLAISYETFAVPSKQPFKLNVQLWAASTERLEAGVWQIMRIGVKPN